MKKYGFLRFTNNSLLSLFTFNIGFFIVYRTGDNWTTVITFKWKKIQQNPVVDHYLYIYIYMTVRNCNQPFHTCKTTKSERAREVLCTLFYMQLLRHSQGQTVGKINKFFIYIQVLFFLCCARLEQSYIKFCCQASQVSVRLQKRNMYAF